MLQEAMEYLVGMGKPNQVEFEGKRFTDKQMFQLKREGDPLPSGIQVTSLQGLADLVREGFETLKVKADDILLHVKDHAEVHLIQRKSDEFGRRLTFITAKPVSFEQFRFGQWQDQESFLIALAARFAATTDKDYVLRIASDITEANSIASKDNGFAQTVTTKRGVELAQAETLKNIVKLAPYRTFPEVGQPISEFLFRVRGAGGQVNLMLTEADGGKWKLDAINEIRRVLATYALDIPIIA